MIRVYGKPGCGTCDALKKKLDLLGVPYQFVNVVDWIDNGDWRTEFGVDFMAEKTLRDLDGKPELPLTFDGTTWRNYPETTAALRERYSR